MNSEPHFTWSDAWLLLAVALADKGNGAGLGDIIATGDYINHAIFTGPELRRGFAKLTHSGYLVENNGRFSIQGQAKDFWLRFANLRKAIKTVRDEFERFLNVVSDSQCNSDEKNDDWQYPGITDSMVQHACEKYLLESRGSSKNPKDKGANNRRGRGGRS